MIKPGAEVEIAYYSRGNVNGRTALGPGRFDDVDHRGTWRASLYPALGDTPMCGCTGDPLRCALLAPSPIDLRCLGRGSACALRLIPSAHLSSAALVAERRQLQSCTGVLKKAGNRSGRVNFEDATYRARDSVRS